MKVLESAFACSFAKFADDGWKQGYHERNGGNLSYRIPTEDIEAVKEDLDYSRPWQEIGAEVKGLAGEFFMVTGSGKYFANVLADPRANCCIIELDSTGTKYRILWGLEAGGRPNAMSVYFTFTAEDIEGLEIHATINSRTTVYDVSELTPDASGKYTIYLNNVMAHEFDSDITVNFVRDGVKVGQTITYTVNSYVISADGYVTNEILDALIKSIYNYGAADRSDFLRQSHLRRL